MGDRRLFVVGPWLAGKGSAAGTASFERLSSFPQRNADPFFFEMQKVDAEHAIRALCHEWRKAAGFTNTVEAQLPFIHFLNWLRMKHPGVLEFRGRMSVRDAVELWFDDEFGRMAQR